MAEDRKSFVIKESENGGVNITDEVVAIIAGLAATEVEGVSSLAGNLTNEVISKAGMNKLSKGVKIITEEENKVAVRLGVNISYGYEIPKICQQVQDKVKNAIENMVGLEVICSGCRGMILLFYQGLRYNQGCLKRHPFLPYYQYIEGAKKVYDNDKKTNTRRDI